MDGWLALFWSYYWLLTHLTQVITALEFSAVTGRVNLQDAVGQMAAFADFNADKATDILVLDSTGPIEARNTPQFIISCVCTGSTQGLYLWSTREAKFFWMTLTL